MNALYLLSSNILPQIKTKLDKKFKKIATFEIKVDENLLLKSQKSVFLNIIKEFEKLKDENDFVIVLNDQNFNIFGKFETNIKIAKHLNCPILSEIANELRILNSNSKLLITNNLDEIISLDQNIITPLKFEHILIERAKKNKKNIILPESEDERILIAADEILKQDIANITLFGDKNEIEQKAKRLNLNLQKANIIKIKDSEHLQKFAEQIYEARKDKGISKDEALNLASERNYFAAMLVKNSLADAVVSGAVGTTAQTIRPALQLIKTKPNISVVSGLFFMALDEEVLLYADCAITPKPDENTLANIAISCANSAKAFGIDPKIAMLSYSTQDSGSGESVELVKKATTILNTEHKNLKVAGPIQYDAATDMLVASKKMPNSDVAGHANTFVFPDLNSANICYKAVQRTSGAIAIGPILQGLNAPVNDLSRGALVQDIVNTILISAIQAGDNE